MKAWHPAPLRDRPQLTPSTQLRDHRARLRTAVVPPSPRLPIRLPRIPQRCTARRDLMRQVAQTELHPLSQRIRPTHQLLMRCPATPRTHRRTLAHTSRPLHRARNRKSHHLATTPPHTPQGRRPKSCAAVRGGQFPTSLVPLTRSQQDQRPCRSKATRPSRTCRPSRIVLRRKWRTPWPMALRSRRGRPYPMRPRQLWSAHHQ
mmetsp:Transcript_16172/g.39880  ORF Transcript_16172/g.39880 Transcript_16172/m.39880 type:complete len:204 (+) Transcript_16172:652-1263(+)